MMAMAELKKTPNDYIFGKLIGEGSFSMVYLSLDAYTKEECAIKVCEKRHIKRQKKQLAIMRERQIMKILTDHHSPYIIQLMCTFQDTDRLYFVMNYAKNGELLPFINKVGSFDEECTRFYAAEILLALEHLHKLGIVHRDLKPENILLNENMHIQISDFGSAMLLNHNNEYSASQSTPSNNEMHSQRRNSLEGTAHYVSPEMLTHKNSTASSDLWALGCIIYQMISGLPPFRAPNEYLIFLKIINLEYEFPDGFNDTAKSLVENLLQLEPCNRLGANDEINDNGYQSIKEHSFFLPLKGKWSNLHNESPPQLLPYLPGTSENEELRSDYVCSLRDLEPGLEDRQLTRLLGFELYDEQQNVNTKKGILDITPEDMKQRIEIQRNHNKFHRFVQDNLILKQGYVDKRKGLFARRRMLLLTTGLHLYYVDTSSMVLKGEIPWSADLRPEPKNFKTFFVHTPKRTYFLEDPNGTAPEWCRIIDEVRLATYPQDTTSAITYNRQKCKDPSRKISREKK